MLGGAGVAGHFVLLFLSIALWWGLGNEIGRGWSALVVAVVWAVIAACWPPSADERSSRSREFHRRHRPRGRSRTRSKGTRRSDDEQPR